MPKPGSRRLVTVAGDRSRVDLQRVLTGSNAQLRRIAVLIGDGINLAGTARVFGLEADNADLPEDNAGLR